MTRPATPPPPPMEGEAVEVEVGVGTVVGESAKKARTTRSLFVCLVVLLGGCLFGVLVLSVCVCLGFWNCFGVGVGVGGGTGGGGVAFVWFADGVPIHQTKQMYRTLPLTQKK
jgi:hypothetical protein